MTSEQVYTQPYTQPSQQLARKDLVLVPSWYSNPHFSMFESAILPHRKQLAGEHAPFLELTVKWNLVYYVDSRDIFNGYCDMLVREGYDGKKQPTPAVMNEAKAAARKNILDKAITALTSGNIELLLMGLGTPQTADSYMTFPDWDLCVVDENGLELVREARKADYTGRIAAMEDRTYTWAHNELNRKALEAVLAQGVEILAKNDKEGLAELLSS